MQSSRVIRIVAASVATCALAIAIPVGRALYLDAPRRAPDANRLALSVYQQMSSGRLDRALLSNDLSAALTPEVLASVKPQFTVLGQPQSLTLESSTAKDGGMEYIFVAHFSGGDHRMNLFLDRDGKVGQFHIIP